MTLNGISYVFEESIRNAVDRARREAGERDVMLLGASIDRQCLNEGLVDEILLHIAPVVICSGTQLFDELDRGDIPLECTHFSVTSQVTSLRFRVRERWARR